MGNMLGNAFGALGQNDLNSLLSSCYLIFINMVVFNSKNVSENELELTQEVLAIFEYYFGEKISLNRSYKNPLRIDNNPGCKFFIGRTGKLLFIDTSRRNSVRDCFGFICDKYNCKLYKALQIINRDFKLGFEGKPLDHLVYDYSWPSLDVFEKAKEEKRLLCLKRNWEFYDKEYWGQYGITLKVLSKFNVIPVQTVFKGNKILWRNSRENLINSFPKISWIVFVLILLNI